MRRMNLFGFGSRGGPISTGWKSTTAAMAGTSASAINLPMLEVPGWLDSHKLPNAVAVVSALDITARDVRDAGGSRLVRLARPRGLARGLLGGRVALGQHLHLVTPV